MNKKINVVIINGKPRSGKDTVINYMKVYCSLNECAEFHSYSTIDPVKDILRKFGWDGEKTPEARNMLALLKQFWVDNCDGPLKYCLDIIIKELVNVRGDDAVLVFQIREPVEIEKLINALKPMQRAYRLNVSTLFINRSEANGKDYGNSSDTCVADYEYDKEIFNNGTIIELEETVFGYMDSLLIGGSRDE